MLYFDVMFQKVTSSPLRWPSSIASWAIRGVTSFSAVAATLNNLGPGLGDVTHSFIGVNEFSKWVCVFAMLLGRLEIFTLLVLFTPTFWQR